MGIWKWLNGNKNPQPLAFPPIAVSAASNTPDRLFPILAPETLGPETLDIRDYLLLLRESTNGPTRDVVALVGGTVGEMLAKCQELAENHYLMTNNLGVMAAFSSTKTDLPGLKKIAVTHNPLLRHSGGIRGEIGVYDLVSNYVLAKTIDNLSSTDGNDTDPLKALSILQTDPRLADGIAHFTWDTATCLRNHRVRGCTLFTIEAGGGSDTLQQLAVDLFCNFVTANRHYSLYLEPSPSEEPLHVPNMRAKVAYALLHQPNTPTINFWWPQEVSGPKPEDKAVLGGIMLLTGNAPDHHEHAPPNQFALLKSRGDWFLVVPRIVPVPLKRVDRLNGDNLPLITQLDLPEELGGTQVAEVLKAIGELLMGDPTASHTITVLGVFTPAEIAELKRGIQRFPLGDGGSLRIVVGYMNPEVRDGQALYLLCDFKAGFQVYHRLRNLLLAPVTASNGVKWDELRALAAKLPELQTAERIHRELAHIRRTTPWR